MMRSLPGATPARVAPHRHWLFPLLGLLLALAACSGSTSSGHAQGSPTPTATHVPPVVYVALGASDAVGVGANNANTEGYVPVLISRLPKGSQALNLGISGIVLRQALQQELPQAIAAHPTLVTVWLAGNDFRSCVPLDQYGADLETLLSQLQNQTHARVFVANLPDMSQLPFFQYGATQAGVCLQGDTSAQIREQAIRWNAVINAAVARHGDVLVDLFASDLAAHPEYIYHDGFHPTSQGYRRLADLFWAQIQAHGGVPQS